MNDEIELRDLLIKKVEVYDKNITAISTADQKGKYKKALKKLREECFSLISQYACEEVYGNLYVIKDEEGMAVMEYGKQLVIENGKQILSYGMNKNMEELDILLSDLRKNYVAVWSKYSPKATKILQEK